MFGRKKSLAQRDSQRSSIRARRSRLFMNSVSASQSYRTTDNSALERTRVLISNSAEEEERSLSNSVSAVISKASSYSTAISNDAVKKMSAAEYVYNSVIDSANSSIRSSVAAARSKLEIAHQTALRNAYLSASNATAKAVNSTHLVGSKSTNSNESNDYNSYNSYNSYKDSSLESTLSDYGNVYQATRHINHEAHFSRVNVNRNQPNQRTPRK